MIRAGFPEILIFDPRQKGKEAGMQKLGGSGFKSEGTVNAYWAKNELI